LDALMVGQAISACRRGGGWLTAGETACPTKTIAAFGREPDSTAFYEGVINGIYFLRFRPLTSKRFLR
jgi:hypothetical protein